MKTAVLKLSGMSCGGCVNMITGLLKSVKGVKAVKVTLKPQRARVKYDNTQTNTASLIAAVKKGGYGASLSKVAAKKKHKCGAGCKCKTCKAKKSHKACPKNCKCKHCSAKKAAKKGDDKSKKSMKKLMKQAKKAGK
ncbi:MAG: copper chaperone [Deltaproteobacteria bacterium]|nr:MAG: copper chaperone [Deltaproteobacteria bacterium]